MDVTLLPNFEGQVMAVSRVEELLRKATRALEAAEIPYAVVGGNAVAAWIMTVDEGAVRATKDVDILVCRDDLGAVTGALRPLDLVRVDVLGVTMFVNREKPNPKTGLHMVFANERIRANYAHPAPDAAMAVKAREGFRVIELPALVVMKLQSFRDIDRVHIRDLLSVGLIDAAVVDKLPADLRGRLQEIERSEQ